MRILRDASNGFLPAAGAAIFRWAPPASRFMSTTPSLTPLPLFDPRLVPVHAEPSTLSPVPRAHAPRNNPGANQWLPIIRLSARVPTMTMPVAALRPPRNTSSAMP